MSEQQVVGPKHALERLGFTITSPVKLIQEVREMIETSSSPKAKAAKLIKHITGLDRSYESMIDTIHIAQSVCQSALLDDQAFDPEKAIALAEAKVAEFRKNPSMAFVYVAEQIQPEQTKEVAGVAVAVKANGKIKKGGKQVIALQLFKEHVVAGNIDNKKFVAILVKELGMSDAGATTYAYNARKAYEKETGKTVEVKKSPRGKKAAASI